MGNSWSCLPGRGGDGALPGCCVPGFPVPPWSRSALRRSAASALQEFLPLAVTSAPPVGVFMPGPGKLGCSSWPSASSRGRRRGRWVLRYTIAALSLHVDSSTGACRQFAGPQWSASLQRAFFLRCACLPILPGPFRHPPFAATVQRPWISRPFPSRGMLADHGWVFFQWLPSGSRASCLG